MKPEHQEAMLAIGEQLRTQDNLCTADPMFCVQILVRDVGYDASFVDQRCWVDSANEEIRYDDDDGFQEPEGDEWDKFGYRDRWETVMVCFTRKGCEEHLRLDGHNLERRAHNGQVRIYVESFRRNPEMQAIREMLMEIKPNEQ